MAVGLPQSYSYRDAKGNTASIRLYLDSSATVAQAWQNGDNLQVDFNQLTNGAPMQAKGPFTSNPHSTTYGNTTNFQNIEDKAVFVFTDAEGSIHRYMIPAPLETIFDNDSETLLITNAHVQQLVSDMLNAAYGAATPTTGNTKAVVGRNGTPLTYFAGGFRLRKRLHRRANIYTLNPSLTGPEE